jgi:antirestriction protein
MTERRIYAACLASYNNGRLHGTWIDADQDADDIRAEIGALLKASPYPNIMMRDRECTECGHKWSSQVSFTPYTANLSGEISQQCPECNSRSVTSYPAYPSAEEFAIHDHEGFGNLIGEYTPIDEVVQLAEAIGEHGDKYVGLREQGFDHDEAIDKLEDGYQGQYDSLEDWAEQFLDDTGLFEGLKGDSPLRMYFDYEAYARDAELNGDVLTIEVGHTVHVFWNH